MFPALILILAATLYRVAYTLAGSPGDWANFSPLAAILLCSAAYLPRKFVWLAALGPLFGADLFLNAHYHVALIDTGMIPRYFCFGLILLLGYMVRNTHKYKTLFILASTLIGSSFFFFFTNTATWLSSPDYAKSLQGWWQALTTGLPGYPPTLLFFRNTLLSDLFFAALFLATQALTDRARTRRVHAHYPEELHSET